MRDSPSDYINITCWGSEMYVRSLVDSFKISDVGETHLITRYTVYIHVHVRVSLGRRRDIKLAPYSSLEYKVCTYSCVLLLFSPFAHTPHRSTAYVHVRVYIYVYLRRLFHQDSLACVCIAPFVSGVEKCSDPE